MGAHIQMNNIPRQVLRSFSGGVQSGVIARKQSRLIEITPLRGARRGNILFALSTHGRPSANRGLSAICRSFPYEYLSFARTKYIQEFPTLWDDCDYYSIVEDFRMLFGNIISF